MCDYLGLYRSIIHLAYQAGYLGCILEYAITEIYPNAKSWATS